jgi:hypothetical protein
MLFLFPIAAMAADNSVQSVATEKKAREKTARGEVKVVDAAARVLIIVGKDEVAFIADESLLRDIRVNDKVTVKYSERAGKKILNSVKIDSKQKGKKRTQAVKPADNK